MVRITMDHDGYLMDGLTPDQQVRDKLRIRPFRPGIDQGERCYAALRPLAHHEVFEG